MVDECVLDMDCLGSITKEKATQELHVASNHRAPSAKQQKNLFNGLGENDGVKAATIQHGSGMTVPGEL